MIEAWKCGLFRLPLQEQLSYELCAIWGPKSGLFRLPLQEQLNCELLYNLRAYERFVPPALAGTAQLRAVYNLGA
jgi:hypothetical protein